jgi:hypothetical protein
MPREIGSNSMTNTNARYECIHGGDFSAGRRDAAVRVCARFWRGGGISAE